MLRGVLKMRGTLTVRERAWSSERGAYVLSLSTVGRGALTHARLGRVTLAIVRGESSRELGERGRLGERRCVPSFAAFAMYVLHPMRALRVHVLSARSSGLSARARLRTLCEDSL